MTPSSDLSKIRAEFSESIYRGCYVNHAAISPLPHSVVQVVKDHLETRTTGKVDDLDYVMNQLNEARSYLSDWIHAESEASVAFVPNTSSGLSYIASSFDFDHKDEILFYDHEFPSNTIPYERLQSFGVNVRKCSSSRPWLTAEELIEHVRPETKMIAVSAVQFISGYKINLSTLGEFCRSTNRYLVVDAIQAAGVIPFDMQEMNIDAWVAGSHKWLCAPDGIALLYASERLNHRLKPRIAGWLSIEEPWKFFQTQPKWLTSTLRFEMGTLNLGGIRALHHSVRLLRNVPDQQRYEHILGLTEVIRQRMDASRSLYLYSPENDKDRAGILTYTLAEGIQPENIMDQLRKSSITVSVREGKVRISPHFYQTKSEMEELCDQLQKWLP